MLHILRISGILPAQKFQPPRIRVWSCPSKSRIIWISVGTKIYLVYCTSKTNICFYILQIVGNQKKQFPPNNLTSFYREQNMRKKTFTKKQSIAATIRRRQTPPSPPITINLQLEKNQKVLSHHQKKKNRQINAVHHFVLTFRADHYFKKQNKAGRLWCKQKISKNPEAIYSWSSNIIQSLVFFCENTTSNCFDLCPACTSARPACARISVARALLFSVSGGFLFSKL